MPKEKLGYPICSAWFAQFVADANDWLDDWNSRGLMDKDGNHTFEYGAMCIYHQSAVYLSRNYWVAMVQMFGYQTEKNVILNDPYGVKPELITCHMNTRDVQNGSFSDIDTIQTICDANLILTYKEMGYQE